jgi:site-specific DNA-methyltransferase (adenine-specific)
MGNNRRNTITAMTDLKPYYADDWATIYCGDCRTILPSLGRFDLCLTDPLYAPETHDGARGGGDGKTKLVTFNSISAVELRAIFSLLNIHGWCVATVDWRHCLALECNPPTGLRFVRFGIWHKPNGMPQYSGDRPSTGWEAVAILHSEGGRMNWNGGGSQAHWSFCKEQNNEHPTQKPIAFASKLIRLFSDDAAAIIDPFMGSGTTLVAAKQLGRKAVGIEIEERYCEIAAKRLSQSYLPLNTEPPAQQLSQPTIL